MSITLLIAGILKSDITSSKAIVNSLRKVDYRTLQTVATTVGNAVSFSMRNSFWSYLDYIFSRNG